MNARLRRSHVQDLEADASAILEHLNRVLAVTDKAKSTWQKRTFRCKGGPLESVCREMPRMALAASAGLGYRLRMNRGVQACQLQRKSAFRLEPMMLNELNKRSGRRFSESSDG
jgi:hypothetical protein